MNKCLIFLTKVYPFDKGEEFIEDEIVQLANGFEKVILIATSTNKNSIQTRKVPDNIDVYKLEAFDIKKFLFKNTIKLLAGSKNKEYLYDNEENEMKKSLKKRMFFEYFVSKGINIHNKSYEILKKYDLNKYDGVTFYSYWFYDTALAALKLKESCTNTNKKCVSRAHRYDLYADENSMKYIPLRYYLLNKLDTVFPCSNDGADYLKKLYPKYSEKIKTSYLGTKDYGMETYKENSEFTIVSCCHVSQVKRLNLLAEALKTLNDSETNIKWIHFGDGDLLPQIKEYTKENLSNINVEFKGNVKNIDLMNYYKNEKIDLFINTSSSEGLPVSIMEACSFGIPCIATDVGGTREIIKEQKTGLLLDVDFTPKELGDKIRYMKALSEKDMISYRNNCREYWSENFYAENNFKKFTQNIAVDV